ncbi:signal peptidase I SipW [Neobacillus kokaensis]|uniref:Signal peptidase I n=1 Tax=Neobacillus kokaensis TaxID=2759023 RepID=A0ABQ3N131_9BACI|nr:signal peptidase I [Neobacillus kokaensis]GHH98289.1 S26 family signal peptidase [Neobacillus kokaensis]
MNSLKKWASRITSLLIYGFLLCMIVLVVSAKISGGTPKVFGYELMSVLSGSMEPSIKTGSIIAVKPISNVSQLKKGDVITFKAADSPDTLITHRIIEVQKVKDSLQFVTKGDNNDSKDSSAVTSDRVVAKYSGFTIPFLGQLFEFMQSKTGAIWLMIVPGVLLILYSIVNIWITISRFEKEKENQKVAS